MVNNQITFLGILVTAIVLIGSCAAPSEPASLASNGSGTKVPKPNETNTAAATPQGTDANVDFGGAPVGDEQMKSVVKSCVSSGKFYDRKGSPTPGCTALSLAQVNCTAAGIGAAMTPKQKTDLDKLLEGLPEYQLDQCLDCTVPSISPFCEGTGDTKKTAPGMRLFYVKQSGTQITIQHVYVTK